MATASFGKLVRHEPGTPTDDVFAQLKGWVHRHGFAVLRGFDVNEAAFTGFAARFGTPIEYGFGRVLDMRPKEGTQESQFTNASMALHQDTILNQSVRARLLAFLCLDAPVPGAGGETLLTDNREFFRTAPSSVIERLRRTNVAYVANNAGYYAGDGGKVRAIEQAPIVRHPDLPEDVLFIGLDDPSDPRRNYKSQFVGMTDGESAEFMAEIDRLLRAPNVLYVHGWERGDIMIVDNFLCCHGRNTFRSGEQRRLVRVSLG